ncbi:DUF899 domain-containing protein [Microbulbifer spongiae]|uniref:DUF899 domain-containing protein n=1 Tax=Microbulbifer spongiae TaxID=2944933 RepID=A0ABY9E9E6_9GAMM|nr:DUF899 domain-containing protein [Microbulbifer sp. MI-G]WKD49674.1 DUF899 domain-containing protein [Microbulbifer sp. MI-G]
MTEMQSSETREISGVARRIVSLKAWQEDLREIRKAEKELTLAHDRVAAKRRHSAWMKVDRNYDFAGPEGSATLADLFDGRAQLIVYHHMLKPSDPSPCVGCCMVADQLPHLSHLHARDTSLVFVSKAPTVEIEAFQKRMGWSIPWFETKDSFNPDFDVSPTGFGLNIFYRDGDDIYRTYFTKGRGLETLGTVWTFLDLTPLGRQENWENAPSGTQQSKPYHWWRRHNEYD